MLSAPNEEYLKRTFELIRDKGYVRVSDIAESLGVKPPSVTRMLVKLEKLGYIKREPYRGFTLTERGNKVGSNINKRHVVLQQFFQSLHLPQHIIDKDIEGLEHYLSEETVNALERLSRKMKAKNRNLRF